MDMADFNSFSDFGWGKKSGGIVDDVDPTEEAHCSTIEATKTWACWVEPEVWN